jgi:cytochrome c oxidase cbb3-type subunit III
MKRQVFSLVLALVFGRACAACAHSPGRPGPGPEVMPPDQIMEFSVLYGQNCAGCHGSDGTGGATTALHDPVFLAIADDAAIRSAVASGVRGTAMPAFAKSAGGMLTDNQINVLVAGIRSWAQPGFLQGANPPSYAAKTPGNVEHGAQVYETFCSSCHGSAATGGSKASSIVDGSYLALVSDQHLRTTVIAGRPELGAPDWRGDVPGRPLSDQELTDVVAWLASHRTENPGQPYPGAKNVKN